VSLPLADGLAQCRRHAEVLRSAKADLPSRFDEATLAAADGAVVRATDQFVLRFIKLQDTLGEHVLRRFATEVLGEPVEDAPLIDVVARLERFGLLDAREWLRCRALRNALTHEYPDQPELRAAILNEALTQADRLADLVRELSRLTPA
jgi:hypothetical protein